MFGCKQRSCTAAKQYPSHTESIQSNKVHEILATRFGHSSILGTVSHNPLIKTCKAPHVPRFLVCLRCCLTNTDHTYTYESMRDRKSVLERLSLRMITDHLVVVSSLIRRETPVSNANPWWICLVREKGSCWNVYVNIRLNHERVMRAVGTKSELRYVHLVESQRILVILFFLQNEAQMSIIGNDFSECVACVTLLNWGVCSQLQWIVQ